MVWGKIMTAVRGHANEAGEAIVDANALTILDQEIRDATLELGKAKQNLADIKAKRSMADEDASKLEAEIAKYQAYGEEAYAEEKEDLLAEIASKLDSLESQKATKVALAGEFRSHEQTLEISIQQATDNISELKREVETVRATEQVQKAQAAVTKNFSGNKASLNLARGSLERIREKQRSRAHQLKAAGEIATTGGDSLEARLKAGGVGDGPAKADFASRFGGSKKSKK
jgi:phage shock protein A